ncbi:hypothetical protein ACB098_05G076000 [Castanea mollissima]|uniref:DUF4228 domain protein n=1 Tax=Castanea mollissima TaxID=60419 RepID=A0A8J4R0A7_9ROSI|nr:hypothetical protein CMV_012934 [Castanea mollissima]
MLIKIVHPGGHYELHDRPVLAAEIILRNPRCCVAHPHVFQKPWAIVAPEAKLLPGQKYYVVPISTIRELQRLTLKYSPSVQQIRSIQSSKVEEEYNGTASACNWFFVNKSNTTKLTYASMKPITSKDGCFSDDNCFTCLLMGIKIKEKGNDSVRETSSSTSIGSTDATRLTRKSRDFTRNGIRRSPKRLRSLTFLTSLDHWQPSLESIKEE